MLKLAYLLILFLIPISFAYADTSVLSPLNGGTTNAVKSESATGSICGVTEPTGVEKLNSNLIYRPNTGLNSYCLVNYFTYDTVALGNTITVSDITFTYTILSDNNTVNCSVTQVYTEPSTLTADQLYDQITTNYEYSANQPGCDTVGLHSNVLDSQAYDDLQSAASTGGNFTVGWTLQSLTRTGSDEYFTWDTSVPPTISVTYTRSVDIVPVTSTTPCFLNYTAGYHMWENCGYDQDFLKAALLPWEWITGGYFSLVIVSILILATYIKYQKIVYPIVTGLLFLPISYFLFPDQFLWFSIGMAGFGIAIAIWVTFIKSTKEY